MAKDLTVEEVIYGRLTLAEALEQFWEIDQAWCEQTGEELVFPNVRGQSREENYRCYILSGIQIKLHNQPEALAVLLCHLEHEYQQQRAVELAPSPATTKRTESSR